MLSERLPKQTLYTKMIRKRPVGRPRTRWLDCIKEFGWNCFGSLSQRNAVCVRGSRGVAALSQAAASATFKEKRVKKKD